MYSALRKLLVPKLVTLMLGCIGLGFPVFAQMDNSAFQDAIKWQPDAQGKLFLNIYDLGYMQNNEFFDSVADGYTLYGNQFHPRLSYYLLDNVRIDGGLFARNDFGNNTWQESKPTLAITVKYDSLTFIFGNLNGGLNHNLIQPMYNFEKIINNRLESGSQFIYKHTWFYGDLWVDWQKMQYFGSDYHEKIWAGLSTNSTLVNTNRWKIDVPFQFTAYHNGGQIDTSKAPQFSQFSTAAGLGIERKNPNGRFFKGWRTENYVLGQSTNNLVLPNTWQKGGGIYCNLLIKSKVIDVMVSYWYGHQYMNLKGGFLYQSISNLYKSGSPIMVEGKPVTGSTFRNRNLLFIRLLRNFNVGEGITVTARMEPFYDLDSRLWEYSYGVFVNFKTDFLLRAIKNID